MVEQHHEQDPKRIEALRMQVDSLIQHYLNQKPTPGISDFAEVFGAEAYVTEMKRQKVVKVDIRAFREEMVTRLLEQSEVSGTEVILPKVFEMLPQTILPPDEGEIKAGSGEGVEKKKYIPRTQYLIDLLSEMGEQYEIMGGKNTSDMMRERTYFIFFLPNSEKAVFINNEEGNTTFIIYQVSSRQEAIDLAALTKDEIRAKELHSHPYVQIDWTGDEGSWKEKILEFLNGAIPENKIKEKLGNEETTADLEVIKNKGYEKIKQNEMTIPMIARYVGLNEGWLRPRIKKLLIEHPDWEPEIRLIPGANRSLREAACYGPEIIAELKAQADKLKKPKKDWLNLFGIAKKIGKDRGWARPRIEELLAAHPEWKPELGLDGVNKEVLYYPPELIQALEIEVSKLGQRPEKDLNIKDISIRLKKGTMWVHNRIQKVLEKHPELAPKRKSLNAVNKEIYYYSPEVVAKLQEELDSLEEADENWATLAKVSEEIDRSEKWIKDRIKKLSVEHPEWEPQMLLAGKFKVLAMHIPIEAIPELKKISDNEPRRRS